MTLCTGSFAVAMTLAAVGMKPLPDRRTVGATGHNKLLVWQPKGLVVIMAPYVTYYTDVNLHWQDGDRTGDIQVDTEGVCFALFQVVPVDALAGLRRCGYVGVGRARRTHRRTGGHELLCRVIAAVDDQPSVVRCIRVQHVAGIDA